jgi:ribosomal protein L7/L12
MELWMIYTPILFFILCFVILLGSNNEKKRIFRMEQRIHHIEDLLQQVGDKVGVDINAVSQKDTEIVQILKQGRKIEAIKRTREIYGYGLKEAKDYVDQLDWKIHH